MGQVEVSEDRFYDSKFVAGVDEEVRFGGDGADFWVLLGGVLEGADSGGADGDDAAGIAAGAIDFVGSFFRDGIRFWVERVIFDFIDTHRLECAEADVEGDLGGFDSAVADAGDDFGSEVESGSGGGDGAAFAGIDGLVAVAVGGGIRTDDVGRKRNVADVFHLGKKILCGGEADVALSELAAGDDFGLKFIVVAEVELLADCDLAAGTDETLPVVGLALELASEEDFNASLEKVATGGIARAERLGLESGAAPIEARGEDARIVEDKEIGGAEEVGEIAELAVFEVAGRRGEMEKAGGGAVFQRLLCDEVFGKMVIEIGDEHGIRL